MVVKPAPLRLPPEIAGHLLVLCCASFFDDPRVGCRKRDKNALAAERRGNKRQFPCILLSSRI